jgi:hypothetical protein
MTATVTPLAGIPALSRTDPAKRMQDYRTSIAFYSELLKGCFDGIIFAENSATDISAIVSDIAIKRQLDLVEFISFYGLDYPPQYGRGYGEFRMIDYAIANSKLLLPDDVIWKVTGRYIVKNIQRIVQSRPSTADIYCHLRNYPYELCELYLLAWNSFGYETILKGIYPSLRNDIIPKRHTIEETLFRDLIDRSSKKVNIVPRFRAVPIVEGVRGWDNSQYSNAWSMKIAVRRLANTFVPSLWI